MTHSGALLFYKNNKYSCNSSLKFGCKIIFEVRCIESHFTAVSSRVQQGSVGFVNQCVDWTVCIFRLLVEVLVSEVCFALVCTNLVWFDVSIKTSHIIDQSWGLERIKLQAFSSKKPTWGERRWSVVVARINKRNICAVSHIFETLEILLVKNHLSLEHACDWNPSKIAYNPLKPVFTGNNFATMHSKISYR